jgi:3-deoxy-7-phosphoheptulonate synthase
MRSSERNITPVREAAGWSPVSWQTKPAVQQPSYADSAELERALAKLHDLPPLVTSWEVLALKKQIAEAQDGRRFLLQGGDCAESFADCTSPLISNRLKVLLQMSLVLVHGLKLPVVRVGRFAGQYAKPRSADLEDKNGESLPSLPRRHRQQSRIHCCRSPTRSAAPDRRTRTFGAHHELRARADRRRFRRSAPPEYWDLEWVKYSPLQSEYQHMVESIGDSLRFMETLHGTPIGSFSRVDFYTSHEALLLHYEQAQTRQVPRQWGWFNLSTHFPWIGMRTAGEDGAHIEYCRGISNPMA